MAAVHLELIDRVVDFNIGVEIESGDLLEGKVIANSDPPTRAEHVNGLGEDVVVEEAGVDGEERHEQDDVAAAEEDLPDLVVLALVTQPVLGQDHEECEQQHDEAVARVAEHHREKERKRDHCERRRVELPVACDTVRVDDVLETFRELVATVVCRRLLFRVHSVQYRLDAASA